MHHEIHSARALNIAVARSLHSLVCVSTILLVRASQACLRVGRHTFTLKDSLKAIQCVIYTFSEYYTLGKVNARVGNFEARNINLNQKIQLLIAEPRRARGTGRTKTEEERRPCVINIHDVGVVLFVGRDGCRAEQNVGGDGFRQMVQGQRQASLLMERVRLSAGVWVLRGK